MEGPISMDNNLIIGASTVEYKEQAVGTLPATDHISLYGKADKHLYWQADDFVEHKIEAGGNVSNAGGSTDNAIARFDATTGKLIQNSLVTIDNSGDISQDGAIWLHTNGGIGNTFIGLFSATSITTGTINTVLGHSTFDMATEATNCTAIGSNALAQLVTGDNCIGLGISAGYNLTLDDSDDICIGNPGESGDIGVVRIGNSTDHNSTFIAGIIGVTHDNSVMIDHKSVIINSLGQIGTIPSCPSGHLNGLKVTDNSTTTKNVSEGSALSDDETTNLTFSGTKTVNITVSGVGGLDTGSEVADTWYYIFIIGDTTLVNDTDVLMSASATAPTMPAGYDVKRLIGAIRNDDSQDFYDYYTQSTGKDRLYLWRESVSTLQVLSDGTAEAWTDVDVSEFIPPISTQLYMQGTHEGSSDTIPDFVSFRPNGSSLDGVARVYSGKTWGSGIFHIETSATGVIEYQNNGSGDNTDVYAVGFTLSL